MYWDFNTLRFTHMYSTWFWWSSSTRFHQNIRNLNVKIRRPYALLCQFQPYPLPIKMALRSLFFDRLSNFTVVGLLLFTPVDYEKPIAIVRIDFSDISPVKWLHRPLRWPQWTCCSRLSIRTSFPIRSTCCRVRFWIRLPNICCIGKFRVGC